MASLEGFGQEAGPSCRVSQQRKRDGQAGSGTCSPGRRGGGWSGGGQGNTDAGSLELEAWGSKPGGGVTEVGNRDTPVTALAGTGVRIALPKIGAELVAASPIPRPPAGVPGCQGMAEGTVEGATIDEDAGGSDTSPNESRKVVRWSLGSGGRGGTTIIQVLRILSRACCMMVAKPKFIR